MAIRLSCCLLVALLFPVTFEPGRAVAQPAGAPPNQITPQAVRQTKQATVFLKVTMGPGQTAEGSGFFAVEPGVVVTNAHVLGMLHAGNRPPTKVDVVIHSGEPNELTLQGQVLGVDRAADLAVLRVEGKLPTPLQLGLKDELFETQKVYIFGFPFGEQLGKNITVSESSVSSLRKDPSGALDRIQVNGGMHPGNSGGPVVNSLGHVVGVSVAGIRATQINFAVPAAAVQSLLAGRIQEARPGEPFREQSEVRVPLLYGCLDPFQRIREMRVEVWAGQPAAQRAYSPTQAKPQPGDGPRQSHSLKYAKAIASGDVPLPRLAAGQVAWVQPVLVFAKGETRWGAPQSFDPALAIARQPASLAFRLAEQKERTVHLKCSQSLTLSKGKSKYVASEKAELDILESFGPDPKGAIVRTGFGQPSLTFEEDGKLGQVSAQVSSLLFRIPPVFVVDDTNRLRVRSDINLNPQLSPLLRAQVGNYYTAICNAYEAANFVMPNRQLEPGNSWSVKVPMLLKLGPRPEVVDMVLTCTYEGIRTRASQSEALVTFSGVVEGREAMKDRIDGQVEGKFTFDIRRGFISSTHMTISSESSAPGSEVLAVLAFHVDLTREEGNPRKLRVAEREGSTPPPPPKGNDNFKTAFTKPARSAKPTSYLKVVSSKGDYIGQGKTYEYGGEQLVVTRTPRGVRVMVDGWMLFIGAPNGQTLQVGDYPNAKRFAFSGDVPGLDFSGNGRGSNTLAGEFVVWELEVDGARVVRLAIDFVQRSEGKGPPLTGKLRLNSAFE